MYVCMYVCMYVSLYVCVHAYVYIIALSSIFYVSFFVKRYFHINMTVDAPYKR